MQLEAACCCFYKLKDSNVTQPRKVNSMFCEVLRIVFSPQSISGQRGRVGNDSKSHLHIAVNLTKESYLSISATIYFYTLCLRRFDNVDKLVKQKSEMEMSTLEDRKILR